MHYYKFNIADYRKDTAHLSRLEHSIYRDLIDWYYLDEKPIPLDTQLVSRRLRLGADEVSFLLSVLTDFFVKTTEGYQHRRIESEIEAYHAQVNTNRENGKKGGRPKATETENNPSGCEPEPIRNPNQEPLTINQEPETKKSSTARGTRLPADWQLTDELKAIAKQIRPEWPDNHVQRIADGFKDYWLAKSGKDATKTDWVATWRNWCRNDKSAVWPSPQPAAPSSPTRASHKPMPTLPPRKPRPEGLDLG